MALRRSFALLYTIITVIASTEGFKYFQDKIPNGNAIPHPCKPNYIWQGVGHKNTGGGGSRNLFGEAFDANGKVWDKTLCELDSDFDGKTNGEELGDPNCVWTEGDMPELVNGLSHPGVCEPLDSETCRGHNDWEFCSADEFSCPAIDSTEDVRNVTLQIPSSPVPNAETNYYCMTFDLPADGDYHIIGSTPVIDNAYVMHHMILFGCQEEDAQKAKDDFGQPKPCGMASDCRDRIAAWTLGLAGECGSSMAGFRMGKSGYKTAILQMHWNNPELRSDYVDKSGMKLYYTPNLRPNDAGMMTIGQRYLEIPGQVESHTQTAIASSLCTNYAIKENIFILGTGLHMHYLGRSAKVDHYRNDQRIGTLGENEAFQYDNPQQVLFDPPIEFHPGDAAKLQCVFDSRRRTETTYYGDSTSAEMCFAFIRYYPVSNSSMFLLNYGDIKVCETRILNDGFFGIIEGCNVDDYLANNMKTFIMQVNLNCMGTSSSNGCKPSCKDFVIKTRSEDKCMGNADIYGMVKSMTLEKAKETIAVWRAFESCNDEITNDGETNHGQKTEPSLYCIILLIATVGFFGPHFID